MIKMKKDFFPVELEWSKEYEVISNFIRTYLEKANASGVIVGLSGGLDSSVVATILASALGSSKVLALIMPTYFTPKEDIRDALELASRLGVETMYIEIDDIVNQYIKKIGFNEVQDKMAVANLRARVRMTLLYLLANKRNYLVAGTSDKSEYILGFFTKYGDGAADLFIISHIYKTQLRRFARWLGLPDRIAYKPSSPQLYPGHKLLDELPADYDILDPIMYALFDLRISKDRVVEEFNYPKGLVDFVVDRYLKNKHKRERIPSPKEVVLQDPV